MRKNFWQDERGDEGEICIGVLAIAAILVIIYYIILFILTYLIQILIIVTIALVVYYVYSKQKEITKWIQPSIVSQTESETSRDVLLNFFYIWPIHNKYNNEYRRYNGLENGLQNLENDIKRTLDTIEDYQRKIIICKNRGEPISPATKTEISILRDKISNETNIKDRLKNQHSNLKNLMQKKRDELDKLKNDVHGIIIGSKNGYKGKYKEEEDAWEKGKSDAAKAAARKEKEEKMIEELVIETNGLIKSAISKTTDGVIIASLKLCEAELSNVYNDFDSNKISYIDARKHILELRDDIRKMGTSREKTTEKSPKETYYDILGVDCNASQDEIQKAYLEIIKKFHSDTYNHLKNEWAKKIAEETSKKINVARDVLSNPEKRKQYNRENGLC